MKLNNQNLYCVYSRTLQNFTNMNCVDLIYKPPRYGSGPNHGHPQDLKDRAYTSAGVILSK